MLLKIMSSEDLADHDPTKCYQIFDKVESAEFRREGGKVFVDVHFMDGDDESWEISSNCYLLNADGTTVAHFGLHGKKR
jgi:hypothetical protein